MNKKIVSELKPREQSVLESVVKIIEGKFHDDQDTKEQMISLISIVISAARLEMFEEYRSPEHETLYQEYLSKIQEWG